MAAIVKRTVSAKGVHEPSNASQNINRVYDERRDYGKPSAYWINEDDAPEMLLQVLLERGWVAFDERRHGKGGWTLLWMSGRVYSWISSPSSLSRPTPTFPSTGQLVNRIAGAGLFTRKDALVRLFRRMRRAYGAAYDFMPPAYVLPAEYFRFSIDFGRQRGQGRGKVWISKPASQSRGRGITVFDELRQLESSAGCGCDAIVQRYVIDPLLVSGYKCDLRLYACVPSFKPLVIYLHREGLVRFGTEKFDLGQLSNVFSHLTNSSINKYSPAYDEHKGRVGHGCKWTLAQLRHHLAQSGRCDWLLWQRITLIVVLTLLTQAPLVPVVAGPSHPAVPKGGGCFELYGFDVLVDDQLRPWLLEVNRSPSLGLDCNVDIFVKKSVLHDLFDLLTTECHEPFEVHETHVESDPCTTQQRNLVGTRLLPHKMALSNSSTATQTSASVDPWRRKWANEAPDIVGGFVRIFPFRMGSSTVTWNGPGDTRCVAQAAIKWRRTAERVTSGLVHGNKNIDGCVGPLGQKIHSTVPDDETFEHAFQHAIGGGPLLTWAPRK